MTERWILKDLETSREYGLRRNSLNEVGRNLGCRIRIKYNPRYHRNEDFVLSVSKRQGIIKINENNNAYYVQLSIRSPTFLIPREERLQGGPLAIEYLEQHQVYPSKEWIQLYPGILFIFGKGYRMELVGRVDKVSELSRQRRVSLEETGEIDLEELKIPLH